MSASLYLFQCSVTCGVGVQQRDVYCRLRGKGPVNELMCDQFTQPARKRPCSVPACAWYQWITEEWQDVSILKNF